MAGMGCIENVIKASYQRYSSSHHRMGIDAKEFLRQRCFGNAVMMIQSCLGAPADMEGTRYMLFAPVHDLAKFIPVVHFLKLQVLHGSSGNDQTIEIPVPNIIHGNVELV